MRPGSEISAVDAILARLDSYWLNQIGNVAVASCSKQIWLSFDFHEDYGGRFGWCWPVPPHDPAHPQDTLLISYCPEIIAEITAHLDEDGRSTYLDAVEFLCSMFIALNSGDPDDARRAVTELLDGRFPTTSQLMAEVETRAIRLGLVPDAAGGDVAGHRLCTACGYINADETDRCVLCQEVLG